ncbi:MAG: hypothetical protein WC690_06515, partial [bacterium]
MLSSPCLFFIGPAASGKTTYINALAEICGKRHGDSATRLIVIDDMPWMMKVFEDDDAREARGEKRLFSTKCGELHSVTDEKVFLEFSRNFGLRLDELFPAQLRSERSPVVVEFCRYGENAYESAFSYISRHVLSRSSIIYLSVPLDETRVRNRYRFEMQTHPGAHRLPDADLARMNSGDDWRRLTRDEDSGVISFSGVPVPFVTVRNHG